MTNKNSWINIVSALTICVLIAQVSVAEEKPMPLAEIPIEKVNNRTVVHIPVANYWLHMVLDTGASSTALFQSSDYEFADLEKTGRARILFPALDEEVEGTRLAPVAIKFGPHTYQPDSLLLIHKRPPIGDRLNFKFDGVLGQDFFMQYVVEIDHIGHVLRLYTKGTDLRKHFFTRIGLHMKGSSPHIKFENTMPWERWKSTKELLLDTGFAGLMVLWNERQFKLAAGSSNVEAYREENKGVFSRASFRIARLKFRHAPIFLGPKVPKQVKERDGLIGAHVVNQFHHVIDFGNRQLLLDSSRIWFNQIDGRFYVPNNESHVYKTFNKIDATAKFVIGTPED